MTQPSMYFHCGYLQLQSLACDNIEQSSSTIVFDGCLLVEQKLK